MLRQAQHGVETKRLCKTRSLGFDTLSAGFDTPSALNPSRYELLNRRSLALA
jgi:hypothetical protein